MNHSIPHHRPLRHFLNRSALRVAPLYTLLALGSAQAIELPIEEQLEQKIAEVEKLESELKKERAQRQKEITADEVVVKRSAYLGLYGEPAGGVLTKQLGIKGGLVVEFLKKGGPAEEAGLQAYDVLQKFNGKQIRQMDDLRHAVQLLDPGDEVSVQLIRGGEHKDLLVVLGEGKEEVAASRSTEDFPRAMDERSGAGIVDDEFLQMLPPEHREAVEAMLAGGGQMEMLKQLMHPQNGSNALGLGSLRGGSSSGVGGQDLGDAIQQHLRQSLNLSDQGAQGKADSEGRNVGFRSVMSTTIQDGEGLVELRKQDGETQLKVSNHQGEVLYEGPYSKEAEMPKKVRQRAEKLLGAPDS